MPVPPSARACRGGIRAIVQANAASRRRALAGANTRTITTLSAATGSLFRTAALSSSTCTTRQSAISAAYNPASPPRTAAAAGPSLQRRHLTLSHPRTASAASTSSPNNEKTAQRTRELNARDYATVSEQVLESLVSQLETLIDESDPGPATADWEVEYSQGVLTLKVPPTGTYVLNKQPPNKQIWLSSPTSGPKKFDYTDRDGVWVCSRDGEDDVVLHELLSHEWSKVFGGPVEVLQELRR
ncbi:unnamed protein product [Parajaminaea phylloscopi]